MKDTKQQFIKQYKELIRKEKESNNSIKAEITKINEKEIDVTTKYPTNYTKNMNIEVNRISAEIIKVNKKNLKIKL